MYICARKKRNGLVSANQTLSIASQDSCHVHDAPCRNLPTSPYPTLSASIHLSSKWITPTAKVGWWIRLLKIMPTPSLLRDETNVNNNIQCSLQQQMIVLLFHAYLSEFKEFLCTTRISIPQQVFTQWEEVLWNVIIHWKITCIHNSHVHSSLEEERIVYMVFETVESHPKVAPKVPCSYIYNSYST